MHLLRHPLMAVLVALVILFGVFFILPLAVSILLHLIVLALVVWVVLFLFRFHRDHQHKNQRL